MALLPGTRLGPYEIHAAIGAGGMGEVYRATDTRLDRTVAIKVLRESLASDPHLRERFEREARAISALDHPHICALYDVGQHGRVQFLVMQHLEGQTLAERLAKGPLPVDHALRYGIQIADALDAAHRRGIVHRDVKPGNMILTKSGAKLLDFGLANLRGPAAPLTRSGLTELTTAPGVLLGTMPYMAPEQVEGREADARSDLFAFGAVLYEMVTGHRAFPGDTPASVIGAILKDDPPPISTLQPLTPPALEHVVQTCLAKDPDERWQSAADVKRELTWIASNVSASGAARAALGPFKWVSWIRWLSTAVLLALLAITGPAAWRQWSTTSPEPTVVRFGILPPDDTTFAGTAASVPSTQFAVSPDGRRLAFVAAPPGGQPALWVRPFDAIQAQRLAGTEGAGYPFWSPDSRLIAFFAQNKLKKVNVGGGPPQDLCDAGSDPRGGTWNRNGVIVFAPNTVSGLFQVSEAGGVSTPLISLRPGENSYRWPWFLPDGRHFLFYVRAPQRQGVYLGSVDTKASVQLFESPFNAIYSPSGHVLTVRDGALLAYPFDEGRMRVAGDPVRVADQVGGSSTQMASFSASANGILAYSGGLTTLTRLEWFNRQGGALGAATDIGDYISFRLSPDERRVAIARVDPAKNTGDIWLLALARGVPTRFTFVPANETAPIWSPDGTRVVYRSDQGGGNFPFEKPSTGGEPEHLIGSFEAAYPTDWSPDGKFIVYHTSTANRSNDVMVLARTSGAKPLPFADSAFTEIDARFSPDGRWLAYASDESGRMEVYVQPFPRSGNKWQVSTSGGSEPHWRRDGKELFYLAPDRKLMAVTLGAASTFESDTPRALFQTRAPFPGSIHRRNYDVTGDGARFLVNTLVEGARSSPITVVLNWTAELKR